MEPKLIYWIKFDGYPAQRFVFDNLDEMWHKLREMFLHNHQIVEWMVRDYDRT